MSSALRADDPKDMSQISPPMRIVLIGAVVFLAAWLAFLRPGGDAGTTTPAVTAPAATATATATTAQSAPGKVVQNARKAADAASASSAASAKASDAAGSESTDEPAAAAAGTAGTTASTSKASTAKGTTSARGAIQASKVGLPVRVASALAADKVLVLYLWNPKAGDDRIVRSELRHVNRHKGKVVVQVADVRKVARYAPIARGVDVQQSPAIVVVDREHRGTLLQGYADAVTIDQAVSDALRAKA
jgi:hypothetical protein